VVNALVVVETVERAEHFVAHVADGRVQRLVVLLFDVPLQRQPGAQALAAYETGQRLRAPAANSSATSL